MPSAPAWHECDDLVRMTLDQIQAYKKLLA
jgi:hypothetical protein